MIALLCALLLAAPSKEELRDLATKIEEQLDAWDVPGASRAVDELVQNHPDSPEAAYYRGRVLFEQGKYDEAVKEYEEATQRGVTPGSFDSLARRGQTVVENDVRLAKAAAEETKGDAVFESEHFVLRTRPGKDTLLAPYALNALEKA